MSRTHRVVAGVDVGGSHTRVVVADLDGRVRGRADGPGANRWSSEATASEAVVTALSTALGSDDLPSPTATVVGTAGWGRQAELHRAVSEHLRAADADDPQVEVVPDVVVNHAAGSPSPSGLVLAAGTGAIAARVEDGTVAARADGSGWLLGDEGSAVWIGLAAVRAALRALDGRGPDTELVAPALGQFVPDTPSDAVAEEQRAALVEAGLAAEPAAFGRLAPAVMDAAGGGDDVAVGIVGRAAEHLARSLRAVVEGGCAEHVVLAGSLLLTVEPLRREVLAAITHDHPGARIVAGHDGAAGAAAIALRRVAGEPVAAAVHAQLCSPTLLPA